MPRIVRAAMLCLVATLATLAGSSAGPAAAEYEAEAARCPGANSTVADAGAGDAERALRCLIDERRGGAGLERNGSLDDAAASHNRHMLDSRCFSHHCDGEPSVEGRIRRSGYTDGASHYGYGEVLASGTMTPADAVRAWLDSPSHRDALLDRSFDDVGIAAATGTPRDPNGGGATYTVDLGHRSG